LLADLTADRNQLLFVPIIHGTSLQPGSAYSVDGHRYRWWVRGVDSAGVPGPWSAAADFGYFEAATPTNLAAPSDGTINSMPELTWAPVAGATKYDIWADDLTTGAAQVLRDGNVTGSIFTPATPLAQGDAFRYWVRAIDASGVASPWSSPLDFTVSSAAPVPEARTDPVIGATLTLSWSKVPGADHYDVWMDDVTTGQSQVARLKNVAGTSVTPSALGGGQHYRWWVRAVDVNGVPGPWSDPADLNYYTIAAPVLVGPTGSTLDSTPTLSWAPVTGATAYDVWVDDVTAGVSQIERNQSVAGISYTPTTSLPMDHAYRFWVRPIDADHNPGPWSTALDFAVSSLLATTVTGPAGTGPGALVGTTMPAFSWTPVTGADHYDLWIDDLTTGEKEVVRLKDVALTHSTPGIALTNGDTYEVWVRAVNAQRQTGPWSDPSEFTIQPHALAGQGQGTYTVQDTVPDIGVTYILQGVANLAELGDVTVKGSVTGTGFIAFGHASGALTFTNDRGTVTVQLQGPAQAGFSFPSSDWQYQVTSGSGDYENLKDQGSLTLTLKPASTTIFGPGTFTLTIAGGQPPQAHSGIEGVAWIGPIFPIDRPGVPNTQPLAGAVISVETADGSAEVARVIADDKGRFDIPLAPGRYRLVPLPPQPGQVWPRGTPQTVDVLADVYTQVTVNYDSGIR
jgi:predicted phage tail protein